MNVEQRQAAVDPQTKPRDLGWEFACRQLLSTTTIAILLLFSPKAVLIYRLTEGRRLSWPRHCRKGAHSHQGCKSQLFLNDKHNSYCLIHVSNSYPSTKFYERKHDAYHCDSGGPLIRVICIQDRIINRNSPKKLIVCLKTLHSRKSKSIYNFSRYYETTVQNPAKYIIGLLPRDSMRKCGLCCRPVSVRLSVWSSVCMSVTLVEISSNFFLGLVAPSF